MTPLLGRAFERRLTLAATRGRTVSLVIAEATHGRWTGDRMASACSLFSSFRALMMLYARSPVTGRQVVELSADEIRPR